MATTATSRVQIIVDMEENIRNKSRQVSASLSEMGSKMTSVGRSLTAGLTLPIVGLGAVALKTAADMQTMEVGFESMTGSAENAKALMEDLISFTAKTPFQLDGVGDATRQLLAFGFEQESVLGHLKTLGDIAAGANVPLGDMAQIFGQASAKGKVMTEQLLQLSDRGVPVIQVLADQMGVAKEEIFDMASKGQIAFEDLEAAMVSMTEEGGIFANQMEKQSNTLSGAWSTLKDNVTLALADVGNTLAETFNLQENIPKMTEKIAALAEAFKNLSPNMQKAIVIVAAIAAAAGPLLLVFGAAATAIASIVTILPLLAGAFAILTGPVGLVIAAIAIFAGLAIIVKRNWESIGDFFQGLWDRIKGIMEGIKNFFVGVWTFLVNLFKFQVALAVGIVVSVLEAMGIDVGRVLETIKAVFSLWWEGLKFQFTFAFEALKFIWTFWWNFFTGQVQPAIESVIGFITDMWTKIVEIWNTFTNPLKEAWSSMWDGIGGKVSGVMEGVKEVVKGAINWIISKINNFIGKVNTILSKGAGIFGFDVASLPTIPALAEGGIVTKPTVALIGEAGPEAVVPLSGANAPTGNVSININWTGAVDRQSADMVAREIMRTLERQTQFSMI